MAIWIALAFAASAPAMSAGEFLGRAEPLMKKSKATLIFSSEARQLARVLGETAQSTRARSEADRAAGRRAAMCLPAKGKANVNVPELLAHLRGLSPAQRAQSFEAAFTNFMARKYPCPG